VVRPFAITRVACSSYVWALSPITRLRGSHGPTTLVGERPFGKRRVMLSVPIDLGITILNRYHQGFWLRRPIQEQSTRYSRILSGHMRCSTPPRYNLFVLAPFQLPPETLYTNSFNHTPFSYHFHLRNPCVRKVIILTSHPTSCGNFFPTVGTNAGYQHGKHVDPRTQNGTPIYGVSVCHLNWKPRCLLLMLPILQLPKGRCDEYVV